MIGALGKLAPRIDVRTLRLASYLTAVHAPPFARDWSEHLPTDLGTYRNFEIGDCTIAAAAHLQRAWSSEHGAPVTPSEADVVAAYAAVSGYRPSDPETDRGADMIAVLKHWRGAGIAGDQIHAFVKLDHDDELQLKTACNLFGGLYAGASLPIAAKYVTPYQWWDVPLDGESTGDFAVGSWGGHCMAVLGYSRLGVCFATWGRRQWATWSWWLRYVDECYGVLDLLWASKDRAAPHGIDLVALDRDLAAIGAA